MLAPPNRVGIRPNGASLQCPCWALPLGLQSDYPHCRQMRFSLSRFKIEPSALPLSWAFCQSRMRQNRALPGPKNTTGRLGDFPSLPVVPSVLLLIFRRQRRTPQQRPTKAPTPRFSRSEVYGDAAQSTDAAQIVSQGRHGASRFGVAARAQTYGY